MGYLNEIQGSRTSARHGQHVVSPRHGARPATNAFSNDWIGGSPASESTATPSFSSTDPLSPYSTGIATPANPSTERAVRYAAVAMDAAFRSLQALAQTHQQRRVLHGQYQAAMREFRSAMSLSRDPSAAYVPAYLFALYEMTVNLDTEDKTWLVHLDGLLTMLRRCEPDSDEARRLTLVEALHMFNNQVTPPHLGTSQEGPASAILVLEVSKLRLRSLAHEANGFFSSGSRPRKLDVQKLKTGLKRVHRDLAVLPAILETHNPSRRDFKRNEHRALAVVVASLLLRCGEHLHPNEAYAHTPEYASLTRSTTQASTEICSSLAFSLSVSDDTNPRPGGRSAVAAFQAMWPLCAVCTSHAVNSSLRTRARDGLQRLGTEFKIPKALSLAMSIDVDDNYADFLAGLILVSFGAEVAGELFGRREGFG